MTSPLTNSNLSHDAKKASPTSASNSFCSETSKATKSLQFSRNLDTIRVCTRRKSKVFVVSIQCGESISVKIEDSLLGEMHKRVMDMYMNHCLEHCVASEDRDSTSKYCFFQVNHQKCYGFSYGLANMSDKHLKVHLDMTESESCYFSPKDGVSGVVVRPKSLKYLGSCISDPEVQEINIHRVFEFDDYEPEDGDN